MCCCGLAKASTTAYNELFMASKALSRATHGAEDGNHGAAAVVASQKVEAAMRRLEPLAEREPEAILTEDGPKDAPDVDSVQSAERRDIDGDDEARRPKVEKPAGMSALPLLPLAILAPWSSPTAGDSSRRSRSRRIGAQPA